MSLPVILADECGNLTGIPLPLNIARYQDNQLVDVNPYDNSTITWNPAFRFFVLWVDFDITFIGYPVFSWEDAIWIELIYQGTGERHRFRTNKIVWSEIGPTKRCFFTVVPPYPIEVIAAEQLQVHLLNYTLSVIDNWEIDVWYTEV